MQNWVANSRRLSAQGGLVWAVIHQGGVTFLPYLSGERTPHNDAAIRGLFIGLGHENDQVDLAQAIIEGVGFSFRDCLQALQMAGTKIERVVAVGGGANSRYWLKAISTILNIPIDIPCDGDFGAAFGAARLGMAAVEKLDAAIYAPRRKLLRRLNGNQIHRRL